MENKIWYLKQINILKSLSEKELMALGGQCSMMLYKRGEHVYIQEGDSNIYFIKSGSIKIAVLTEEGSEQIKEIIEAGEIFGRFIDAVSDQQEQVVAVEDCMVCYLPFTNWQNFIKENEALSYSFIKWIGLRIKKMERKMDSLYFKNSRQRIAESLQDIIQRFGKPDAEGNTVLNLNLTHDEMAQLTGTSRQSVNMFMNELRDKGWIEYRRNKLVVKPTFPINDIAALSQSGNVAN